MGALDFVRRGRVDNVMKKNLGIDLLQGFSTSLRLAKCIEGGIELSNPIAINGSVIDINDGLYCVEDFVVSAINDNSFAVGCDD